MHYWSHSGKIGVPIEYDGVPFMHVGRWSLVCHQGRDTGSSIKNKYLEKKKKLEQEGLKVVNSRKSSSKKVNCPAEIYVSHVVKFPQFKVSSRLLADNSLPSEPVRKNIKEKLRLMHKRDPRKVVRHHCYYVRLPQPGDHQGHPFVAHVAADDISTKANVVVSNTSTLDRRKINKNRDKYRRTKEPIDNRVAAKLSSLIKEGFCSTAVIRSELNKFVIQELFSGEAPPPAMFRRYNPTSRDIQNALHKVKQEAYMSHRRELRSLCSDALKDIENSLISIEDEVTLGNLYKRLAGLRKQIGIGADYEDKDCSVSIHQLVCEEVPSYQVVTLIEEPSNLCHQMEQSNLTQSDEHSQLQVKVSDSNVIAEVQDNRAVQLNNNCANITGVKCRPVVTAI